MVRVNREMPRTAEGQRLRSARKSHEPPLSIDAAARLAGISTDHWGNIERGYERRAGVPGRTEIDAQPAILAKMALATGGITPEDLEDDGRADAAAELRRLLARDERHLAAVPAELSDELIEAFIRGRPDTEQDVLWFIWRRADTAGTLRPRAERYRDLLDWVNQHPRSTAQTAD